MSNAIEFFGAEQLQLAVPGGGCAVFLDGALCEFLEVVQVVRAGDPEFGYARLRYNTAAGGDEQIVPAERIGEIVPMARAVSIRRLYDSGIGEATPEAVSIFEGHVERVETKIADSGEVVDIIVRDISATLGRITVYGRRVATGDGGMFIEGLETVFNEDGAGNASPDPIEHNGRSYTAFAADSRRAKRWSCVEIIVYLLSEHLVGGQLGVPVLQHLEAIMAGRTADEVDVTGLSLTKALSRVCEDTGVRFRFVGRQCSDGPAEGIVFYHPGFGRRVEVNRQLAGEKLRISKTQIWRLESERDFWPVTHRYIGRGDFKVFEGTFELVKAWDPAGQGGPQSDYSPSTNADFDNVRDVYRRWCLNEAGDYTGPPFNRGQAFDFSKIFETDRYVQCRRSFQKALSTDSSNASLGYYLEVSYDDGGSWQQYTDDFDVLSDECGIWLSSDQLSSSVWTAISADTLQFRMTAAVASDERLRVEMAAGPVNSTAEVVDHVVELASRFKYRKVSGKSVFHNSTSDDIGEPDEVDDTAALTGHIRRFCETNLSVIEEIDVQTAIVMAGYQVGDRVVCGAEGRDILGTRADGRSIFWIERVVMDFAKQSTRLRILRRRFYA